MGFIDFNVKYYEDEICKLERSAASQDSVYRAKRLLKILDDLEDEGYSELSTALENAICGVSRLRKYIADGRGVPFAIPPRIVRDTEARYGAEQIELTRAIEDACMDAEHVSAADANPFLDKLLDFGRWIGFEDDTAYVFLLRDTLLPYVYFKARHRARIYPWLLGRRALRIMIGKPDIDDDIRGAIIGALERGRGTNFEEFRASVIPEIKAVLAKYPSVADTLADMLGAIPEKRIVAVESGCSGTFPMLLTAIDARVDVRMYTTYPYLLDAYGDRIFTAAYEENRLFETLYSQDVYFRLSAFEGGRFFVQKCADAEVQKIALGEIRAILDKA